MHVQTETEALTLYPLRIILECSSKDGSNRHLAYWTRDRICRDYSGDPGGLDQLYRALCEDWVSADNEHTLCSFLLARSSSPGDRSACAYDVVCEDNVSSFELRVPCIQF